MGGLCTHFVLVHAKAGCGLFIDFLASVLFSLLLIVFSTR